MELRLLRLFILCLSIILTSTKSWSTPKRLPLIEGKTLSTEHWRWDVNDFYVSDGIMHLNGPFSTTQSTVFTSIDIQDKFQWRGDILFKEQVSIQNTTYILLALLKEEDNGIRSTYMALEFGGRAYHSSLVKLTIEKRTPYTPTTFRTIETEYLLREEKNALSYAPFNLSYEVNYVRDKGWQVSLKFKQGRVNLGWIRGYDIPKGETNFGIMCNYSKKHRQRVAFSNLIVSDEIDEDNFDTSEIPTIPKEETKPTADSPSPIITEIMYNPKEDGVEYIEIYNPSEQEIQLDNYNLFLGQSIEKAKQINLADLPTLEAKSYLVLTTSPLLISKISPEVKLDRIKQFALPRLNNNGFFIGISSTDEQIVDILQFDKQLLPKAWRKKRGIPLVRKVLTPAETEEEAINKWKLEDENLPIPSPGEPNLVTEINEADGSDRIKEFASWFAQHPQDKYTIFFYDMRGYHLAQSNGVEIKKWLKHFLELPVEALREWQFIPKHPLILHIIAEGKDEEKAFSIPFINP